MTLTRLGLVLALVLGGAIGCVPGGPERASDIQNLNGIGDDISAVTMTQSENLRAKDPNVHSTIPRTYETFDTR
ncbi:MAG TPA: hypothetical protein VHY35_22885 [Stellaceae bacterium]|jgi:hypothetical protein|nr:hypothetical protein [Stellaceae bacterium]